MCNFLLALRGEDARRAGEGLVSSFNSLFLYEKINLNPNDNYESQRIGASPKANKG